MVQYPARSVNCFPTGFSKCYNQIYIILQRYQETESLMKAIDLIWFLFPFAFLFKTLNLDSRVTPEHDDDDDDDEDDDDDDNDDN